MSDSVFSPAHVVRADLAAAFLTRPAFIDVLPSATYACDAHGRLLWFNLRATHIWARVPQVGDDEWCCGSYRMLLSDEHAAIEAPVAQVLHTGEASHHQAVRIVRADGSSIAVLMHVDPVVDASGQLLGGINCFHEIAVADQANTAEWRACELLRNLPAAVYTVDTEGRLTFFNAAAAALWGVSPTLGSDRWCGSWRLYTASGAPLPRDECPMAQVLKQRRAIAPTEAIAERPDGIRVPFLAHPSLVTNSAGEVIGAVNLLLDLTERKRADVQRRGLVDEFSRCAANTLATVQSLAAHTLRSASLSAEAHNAFQERLFALGRTHDHLSRSQWESADLEAVIREALQPHCDDLVGRVCIQGELIQVSPQRAVALSLVIHELASNAAQHGALSAPEGKLEVRWRMRGRMLDLTWRESGGPPVHPPALRGFGTRLLERCIGGELGGTSELAFPVSGVCCRIGVPLAM